MRACGTRFVISLLGGVVLLSGCSGMAETARPAERPTSEHAVASHLIMTALGLAPGGLGVVAGATQHAGRERAQVFISSDGGASFRDVTPPGLPKLNAIVDDVAVKGPDLWVLAWDLDSTYCRLYRSSDAGRTWASAPAPGHNMSAGSRNTISFPDTEHGWLLQSMPNGPVTRLYRTVDGGRHWRLVADPARRLPGPRPTWRVAARPSPAAYSTSDAGSHWRRHPLPVARAGWLQVTGAGPRHAWVLNTARNREDTALLATADGGRTWTPLAVPDQTSS